MAKSPQPGPFISWDLTRRDMMVASAITAMTCGGPSLAFAQAGPGRESARPASGAGLTETEVSFTVNGTDHTVTVDNRQTLLDTLRETLKLTGTKKGCDHGQCGACTVIVNGRRINACLSLAVMHDGDAVLTIEGIGTADRLDPLQAAFVAHDGYQCGYCTPGQICSAKATLDEIKAGIPSHVTGDLSGRIATSPAEIRERMSGNICRCGAYANILAAIQDVVESDA